MNYKELAKQYFKTDDIQEVSGNQRIANDHMDESPWSDNEIRQSEIFDIVNKEYCKEYFVEFGDNIKAPEENEYLTNLYGLRTKFGLIAYCDSSYPFFYIRIEDYNELVQSTYSNEYKLAQETLGTKDIVIFADQYCLQEGHNIDEELTTEEKLEVLYYNIITKNINFSTDLTPIGHEYSSMFKAKSKYGLIVIFADGLSWLYISKENYNKIKI